MPAGRPPLAACKVCQKPVAHRSELSKRGRCPDCAQARIVQSNTEIAAHRGPYFKYWRQRMAASVGGVLLDDVTGRE